MSALSRQFFIGPLSITVTVLMALGVNPTGFQAGGKSITGFCFDAIATGGIRSSHIYALVDSERAALNALPK